MPSQYRDKPCCIGHLMYNNYWDQCDNSNMKSPFSWRPFHRDKHQTLESLCHLHSHFLPSFDKSLTSFRVKDFQYSENRKEKFIRIFPMGTATWNTRRIHVIYVDVENSSWNIRWFYVEKWSSGGQISSNVESTSIQRRHLPCDW